MRSWVGERPRRFEVRDSRRQRSRGSPSDGLLGVVPALYLHYAIAEQTPFAAAIELRSDDSGHRLREPEVSRVAGIQFHRRDRHWSTALPAWAGTLRRSGPTRPRAFNRFIRRPQAMGGPVRSGINLASPTRHA